jgi:FixJ family two-component response regulator
MSPRERVFVVDDDPVVRRSLARVLRLSGFDAATFESAEALLDGLEAETEGCAILDLALPGLDGLALQESLQARGSALSILFLSGRGDIPGSVRAMKAGATDFLTKPVESATLIAAVRHALERGREASTHRREAKDVRAKIGTLTPREREVLENVVAGRLNKQIAGELGISEATVKVHRARVMEKMGVSSVADLVRCVERVGHGRS